MIHSEDFFFKFDSLRPPPRKKRFDKKWKIVHNNCESHKMVTGCCKKYPVNACGVRDGLSGDMLALSRCSLVIIQYV